jgi:methyl halide transferase
MIGPSFYAAGAARRACARAPTRSARELRSAVPSSLPSSSSPLSTNAFGSNLPDVLDTSGWEGVWKHGMTPWDAGKPAPLVRHLLSLTGEEANVDDATTAAAAAAAAADTQPFGGRPLPPGPVLVPGAGSGYDALEFARAGRPTVSVDIAPTAVEAALRVASRDADGPALLTSGRLEIRAGDFFSPSLLSGPTVVPGSRQVPWGVVFDYTFLCALPPSMRGDWARAMTTLVRPGSELVCLIYPIGDHVTGPPFAMQPTTIRDLLEKHAPGMWEESFLAPVPAPLSHGSRVGREWLGRYVPRANRYPSIRLPTGEGFAEPKKHKGKRAAAAAT